MFREGGMAGGTEGKGERQKGKEVRTKEGGREGLAVNGEERE